MSEQKHYLTLTIDGGELHRGFVCESAPDATCRKRPRGWEDGERDSWTSEEATETGFDCWAVEWIEAAGIENSVLGADAVLARVPVSIVYDEGVEVTPLRPEQFEQDDRAALRDVIYHYEYIDGASGTMRDSEGLRSAILAAGFHRSPAPQQVSTVEELDALPVGSVVLSGGEVYVRIVANGQVNSGRETWRCLNDATGYREWDAYAARIVLAQGTAVTVLYRPERGEE